MNRQEYLEEMKKLDNEFDALWRKIVDATIEFRKDAQDKDSDIPETVEKIADDLCLSGAWIYDRLNGKLPRDRGSVTKKIRKALGYTYP